MRLTVQYKSAASDADALPNDKEDPNESAIGNDPGLNSEPEITNQSDGYIQGDHVLTLCLFNVLRSQNGRRMTKIIISIPSSSARYFSLAGYNLSL